MASSPEQPAADSRALAVMFGLVVALALGLLGLSWHASLLDRYEFRQLQTALTTYWIAHDGWQLAYLTPLFGPPWSVPMEFPTYQLIVAAVHRFGGLPLEQSGRLISILFLLATLPAVFDLLALAVPRASRRLIVLALILSSPVYLFYGRTFMIETTGLCFTVWFLAAFRRALLRPDWRWVAATTLFASLAALTKITTFLVYGLPALALVLAAWRGSTGAPNPGGTLLRRLLVAIIPAAVSLGLAWWWVRFSDHIKDSNPFTGFLTARELQRWNFGDWALRFDWSFWQHLQENVTGYVLAEGAGVVGLLCWPFAPWRARWMALAGLLGFFSGPLLFANLYHIHDYYYAANALLLVGSAGLLLAACWDDPRLPRGANWLALVAMLACQYHAFYRGYYSHHRQPAPPPPGLAAVVRQAVPADGVVLIYGADWNPLLPYYAERRALMVPGERQDETAVLEQVLARLPPRRIAAMIVEGGALRGRPDFIRERTGRFSLAPEAVARSGNDELYLPEAAVPAVVAGLVAHPIPSVELLAVPAVDPFTAALNPDKLSGLKLEIFHPAPAGIRSRYGVSSAVVEGRPVLNAHAPSELEFVPPAGAHRLRAVAGLPDAAFAPGRDAVTDGITIDILEVPARGPKRVLYHRQLDPLRHPEDRGPQVIELDRPDPFSGHLLLRLGNGPDNNATNDWAYWAAVEIR